MSGSDSDRLRRERLAAALRENLRRRKEQGRSRRAQAGSSDGPETPPAPPEDRRS